MLRVVALREITDAAALTYRATFVTVSQVRVVTSFPSVFSISVIANGTTEEAAAEALAPDRDVAREFRPLRSG